MLEKRKKKCLLHPWRGMPPPPAPPPPSTTEVEPLATRTSDFATTRGQYYVFLDVFDAAQLDNHFICRTFQRPQ